MQSEDCTCAFHPNHTWQPRFPGEHFSAACLRNVQTLLYTCILDGVNGVPKGRFASMGALRSGCAFKEHVFSVPKRTRQVSASENSWKFSSPIFIRKTADFFQKSVVFFWNISVPNAGAHANEEVRRSEFSPSVESGIAHSALSSCEIPFARRRVFCSPSALGGNCVFA